MRANLLKKTKTQLVDMLMSKSSTSSVDSKPLSSSEEVRKKIELAEKFADTDKVVAEKTEKLHESVSKLVTTFIDEVGADYKNSKSEFDAIKDSVKNTESIFKADISIKEEETKEKLDELQAKITEKQDELDELKVTFEESKQDYADKLKDVQTALLQEHSSEISKKNKEFSIQIEDIKSSNVRKLKDLGYAHEDAVKTANTEFINSVAKSLNKVVVESSKIESLEKELQDTKDSIKSITSEEVAKAVASTKRESEKTISELQHSKQLEVSKLQLQVESKVTLIEQLNSRVQELTKQNAQLVENQVKIANSKPTTVNVEQKK